jgi:uncharacterized OB-fold protein
MSPEAPRPLPTLDGRMGPFWRTATSGKFSLQHCRGCGLRRFPPTELCSVCLSPDLDWVEACGHGELYSFVVVHHALDPFFASRVPYVVADVRLVEGPHVTTTIVGCDAAELRIGQRVTVEFERVNDELFLPVFRRVVA